MAIGDVMQVDLRGVGRAVLDAFDRQGPARFDFEVGEGGPMLDGTLPIVKLVDPEREREERLVRLEDMIVYLDALSEHTGATTTDAARFLRNLE